MVLPAVGGGGSGPLRRRPCGLAEAPPPLLGVRQLGAAAGRSRYSGRVRARRRRIALAALVLVTLGVACAGAGPPGGATQVPQEATRVPGGATQVPQEATRVPGGATRVPG